MILLREGTDTSQGKAQLISNINACCAVTDIVRTTLVRRRRAGTLVAAARRVCASPVACVLSAPGSRQAVASRDALECLTLCRRQGPLGMDKLVYDSRGTTISNDGATIMKASHAPA